MLKLAVVTPWDVQDARSWSGTIVRMIEALQEHADVLPIDTRSAGVSPADRVAARLLPSRFGSYHVGHALATSRRHGAWLARRLREVQADAVVAIAASQDIAFLPGPWPVVQVSDLTFRAAGELYRDFASMSPVSRRQATVISQMSARRVAHTLAASEWVAGRLLTDDRMHPDSVTVAPFGPGIPPTPRTSDEPAEGRVKILAVISNWERKRGDDVLAVRDELLSRGVQHDLTVVGRIPVDRRDFAAPGLLNQKELAGLYSSHHVLLEPSRGNASGMTLTDATHAGMVAVAADVGGVSTIVKHGHTGLLVRPTHEDNIGDFADAVERAISHWPSLSAAARRHAVTSLTWDGWADSAITAVRECISRRNN